MTTQDAISADTSALTRRLHEAGSQLSEGRRKLIDGILSSIDETVFLSSRELAARFETDPATVVRTVQALGYPQFADFTRDLRSHFLAGRTSPYQVMAQEATAHQGPAQHVQLSLKRDLDSAADAARTLDPAMLAAIGRRMESCRHVLVMAADLEHTLAEFLAYGLSGAGVMATAPSSEGLTLCRLRAFSREDALIAIGFGRCLRVPVEAMQAARAARACTVAITDSQLTPLAQAAEHTLLVPVGGESYAGSYVATMMAINSLLVACAHANPKRTLKMLKPTEDEYANGLRWYQEPTATRRRTGKLGD